MKDALSFETKDRIKILGYYQLIGGIVGLFLWIKMLINLDVITGLTFLFILIIGGLYSFSFYVGLITVKSKGKWLLYSQINQIIQIFNISLLGYSFRFISGLGLITGFDWTESLLFKFNFYISDCSLSYNYNSDKIIMGFNIIAIGILYYINKLELSIKTEKENYQNLEKI